MATKKADAKKLASKAPVKKAAAKKTSAKAVAQKSTSKSAGTRAFEKGSGTKGPASKAAGRKYSPAASRSVEREMKEMHQGKLTIGRSTKKVTNPKQAIAIGLSEARKAGAKVPPPPKRPR